MPEKKKRKKKEPKSQKCQSLKKLVLQNLITAERGSALHYLLQSYGYELRLPDVICIGVKQSGTTLFRALLHEHPQLVAPLLPLYGPYELLLFFFFFFFFFLFFFFDWNYAKGLKYYKCRLGFVSRDMLSFEKIRQDISEQEMLLIIFFF